MLLLKTNIKKTLKIKKVESEEYLGKDAKTMSENSIQRLLIIWVTESSLNKCFGVFLKLSFSSPALP